MRCGLSRLKRIAASSGSPRRPSGRRRRCSAPARKRSARASDKAALPRRLARVGVRHPTTRALRPDADWARAAREIGYPVVVKPARGAGCDGVCLARNARELRRAVAIARRASGSGRLVLQEYVTGRAASVSLLADGRRAVALTVNAQIRCVRSPAVFVPRRADAARSSARGEGDRGGARHLSGVAGTAWLRRRRPGAHGNGGDRHRSEPASHDRVSRRAVGARGKRRGAGARRLRRRPSRRRSPRAGASDSQRPDGLCPRSRTRPDRLIA